MARKILITGANSYIGVAFDAYIKQKYSDDYTIDTLDMLNEAWKEFDFSEYGCVLHLAGMAHQKETRKNAALYYSVNRDLACAVAEKAKSAGVKQFVFLSTMSVYGLDRGIVTRDTCLHPKSHYGKSKLQAEEGILKLEDSSFRVCIIRPPMVYGKNCKGNFQTVLGLVRKLPFFPQIENRRSMIYIDHLLAFFVLAIQKELTGIFMPQNQKYMNTSEMAKWIADSYQKKLRLSKFLGFLVKCTLPFTAITRKAFGTLIYHEDLEEFDFCYCAENAEDSVKNSV